MVFVKDEDAGQLARWLIRRLLPSAGPDQNGITWFNLSEAESKTAGGARRLGLVPAPRDRDAPSDDADDRAPDESLCGLLVARLCEAGHVTAAAASNEPSSVHELADRLYAAYQVDGGTAHLAGCTLEDRLLVKFSLSDALGDASSPPVASQRMTDAEGNLLDDHSLGSLDVDVLSDTRVGAPPRWRLLARIVAAGLKLAEREAERAAKSSEHRDPSEGGARDHAAGAAVTSEQQNSAGRAEAQSVGQHEAAASDDSCYDRLAQVTLIRCKHAAGKLCFTIGEHSAEVTFNGWARRLEPPPIECPQTSEPTFHLAATDNGRIAAVEEIAACEQTGRRMLRRELVVCSQTGQSVVPELTQTCPVTGKHILSDALRPCTMCQQRVSPGALSGEICAACRGPAQVTLSDPRLARILDEHPGLESWRAWQLAETSAVYVLVASGWFRRLFVAVDRDTLEPLRVARSTRLKSEWEPVAEEEWKEVLS